MKLRGRIIWGALLILAGVLIALAALGMLEMPMGLSPWRIILGALVLCVLIDGLSKLDFVQSFLMVGIEVMLFEGAIGTLIGKTEENWISNWTVIFVSILIGAGLDMIFKGFKRRHKFRKTKTFSIDMNAFGDHLKYIDASRLGKEYIRNKFGDFEIRFENADDYRGGGELTLDNAFGDMIIYVPSNWEVEVNVDSSFGDLSVDNELKVQYADGSAMKLVIKGTNRFGDMYIRAQR